ncbi:MAG: response regulator [Lachnospiraceae bacterium]|nr:response regulator [Lachnospiraceae bacterium]
MKKSLFEGANKAMDIQKVRLLGYGVSSCFLIITTAMFFFFRYFGVTPLGGYSIFSICFYLFSYVLVRRDMFWIYSVLSYLEVLLHMNLVVFYVGTSSGFQFTLIGMNLVAFYSEYLSVKFNFRRVNGIALGCLGMASYTFCYAYSWIYPSPYELPESVCFWLQIALGITIFAVNIFFLKLFVTITLLSEHLLSEAKTQASSMVTALSSDYRSVYYVNLDKDIGICYREDPRDHKKTPEGVEFPFLSYFSGYGRKCVDESYREGFLKFISPESIRENLEEKPVAAYRYLANREGIECYEMVRVAGVRQASERDDHMIHSIGLGVVDIDEEMRETMAKNEALAKALVLAEEASKAKTSFLSSMSHEIRTPMNAIIGLDTLALNDDSISPHTREYLEKIGSSARHLLALINDILDMSRIESGRMVLSLEEFSFSAMLEQINTMVMSQCRDKGIDYESRILTPVDDCYVGDVMKLKEVLINILSNAIKFTDAPGKVKLTVERKAQFEKQSTLQFRIKDSGIGMDKEFIPKIFDAFSQEDSSRKSKYGSTGLGMAITRNLVEMMNGTIEVESEKGVGTEFIVTITLKTGSSGQAASQNEEQLLMDEMKTELSGRRILIAEDVEINAEIVQALLEMNDIESDHGENGRVTFEMFEKSAPGTYSAILMDVRMPEMDGLEAAAAIRALDREDAKRIPIVAMTANAFDEDVQRSLQAGMNAHLTKPVEEELLLKTLGELIGKAEKEFP